jgi:hypothetical protein
MPVQAQQEALIGRFGTEVAEIAREMVQEIGKDHSEIPEVTIAPLRRLQGQCERYLGVARSGQDRFLLFFLSVFLEDVFYNLSGDVPYNQDSDRRKRRFFGDLAKELERLGVALSTGGANQGGQGCQRMVASYLDTITEINDLLATE